MNTGVVAFAHYGWTVVGPSTERVYEICDVAGDLFETSADLQHAIERCKLAAEEDYRSRLWTAIHSRRLHYLRLATLEAAAIMLGVDIDFLWKDEGTS